MLHAVVVEIALLPRHGHSYPSVKLSRTGRSVIVNDRATASGYNYLGTCSNWTAQAKSRMINSLSDNSFVLAKPHTRWEFDSQSGMRPVVVVVLPPVRILRRACAALTNQLAFQAFGAHSFVEALVERILDRLNELDELRPNVPLLTPCFQR